jgi:serine/threonine protein kinase/outer membrane protein assembly factor BamB
MPGRMGQQLGNYRLIRLLGSGGFAEVYLGVHRHLNTQVAIKILHSRMVEEDIEYFRREAQIVATLVHPHIVRVFDFDVQEGVAFLVMDYAPHGSLRQRHPRGQMVPLSTVVSYVKQVAEALQYAHSKRLIHRDVKPENLLLGLNGEVLLSDFGIATIAHSTSSQSAQAMMGTIAYMAPEQIQEHPRPASDQFSLGVVVYELLCGKRPFQGSLAEIIVQSMAKSPPSLGEKIPAISSEVEKVVFTALAKDYKQRFASVKAFATALEQASQEIQPVPIIPPRSVHPVSSPPSQQPEASILSQHSPQPQIEILTTEAVPLLTQPVSASAMQPSLPTIYSSAEPSVMTDNSAIASHRKSLSRGRVLLLVALVLLFVIASTSVLYTLRTQVTTTAKADLTATADAAMNAYDAGVKANGIMFGFDSQHTHLNPYERILSSSNVSRLVLDWTGSTGGTCCLGELVSSPVVAYSIVYVGSFEGKLYAFKASGCGSSSCAPLWTASTGNIIFPSLAIVNGVVYAGSSDHKLYAFNASGCGRPSCSPLWTATVKNTIISSPTIAQGMIYVGSDDDNFYAFNASGCGSPSCSPVWMASTGGYIESSPAVANNVVYVGSLDHKFYAFQASGCGKPVCSPLWTATAGSFIRSSPAVANNVVYVGSDDGKLYAFNASGCGKPMCSPLWTDTAGKRIRSSPAVANNVVYVGSDDDKLYAFNASGCGSPSCSLLWTASTGDIIISSPAIANGVVYVGSEDHRLYAFNASGCGSSSCQPLWTFTTKASIHASPAVANGIVYIVSYDSILYAFHLP